MPIHASQSLPKSRVAISAISHVTGAAKSSVTEECREGQRTWPKSHRIPSELRSEYLRAFQAHPGSCTTAVWPLFDSVLPHLCIPSSAHHLVTNTSGFTLALISPHPVISCALVIRTTPTHQHIRGHLRLHPRCFIGAPPTQALDPMYGHGLDTACCHHHVPYDRPVKVQQKGEEYGAELRFNMRIIIMGVKESLLWESSPCM